MSTYCDYSQVRKKKNKTWTDIRDSTEIVGGNGEKKNLSHLDAVVQQPTNFSSVFCT